MNAPSFTPSSPLTNGTSYEWTVSADVSTGGTTYVGQESPPAFFTVDTNSGPMLLSPPNNAFFENPPTFQWSAVPNAETYTLVVAASGAGATNQSPVIDVMVAATSYTPPDGSVFTATESSQFQWSVTRASRKRRGRIDCRR